LSTVLGLLLTALAALSRLLGLALADLLLTGARLFLAAALLVLILLVLVVHVEHSLSRPDSHNSQPRP
jgi:hypothetical protein